MKDLSSFKRCEHLEENFNLEKYFDLEGFGKALVDNIDSVLEYEFLEVQDAKEKIKKEFAKLEKAYLIHDLEKIQDTINEYLETIKYYQDKINYVYDMSNTEVANWFLDMYGYESLENVNIDSYIDYKSMFYDNVTEFKIKKYDEKVKVYTVSEFKSDIYEWSNSDNIIHIVTRDRKKAIDMVEKICLKYKEDIERYVEIQELTEGESKHYLYYDGNDDGGTVSFLVNEV